MKLNDLRSSYPLETNMEIYHVNINDYKTFDMLDIFFSI